jgi:hypothetical protein
LHGTKFVPVRTGNGAAGREYRCREDEQSAAFCKMPVDDYSLQAEREIRKIIGRGAINLR